jgi:hypothetical protein
LLHCRTKPTRNDEHSTCFAYVVVMACLALVSQALDWC